MLLPQSMVTLQLCYKQALLVAWGVTMATICMVLFMATFPYIVSY